MTTGPEWGGRLGTQQRFADVRIATDLPQLIQWRHFILRGFLRHLYSQCCFELDSSCSA